MIRASLATFGRYILFMLQVFRRPNKHKEFFRQTLYEIYKLGVGSIPLVMVISIFIGAVILIQMSINVVSPFIPKFSIGLATREILILEFSCTMVSLILAGKVGSYIASEIGTMRVTEQIDAMEIMGINSANYIALPKIVGFVAFVPVLYVLSIFMGFVGGALIAKFTDMLSMEDYVAGLQTMFTPWYVWYAMIKTLVFAFIISTVASFYGYYVKGGAREVGQASTQSVVASSILILLADVVLTKLLLQ